MKTDKDPEGHRTLSYRIASLINQHTIKSVLLFSFALVIVFGMIIVLLAEWTERYSVNTVDRIIAVENQISDLCLKSNMAMLNARRNEKDFLLTYKDFGFDEARSRYITRVLTSLADIREYMGKMRSLSGDAETRRQTLEVERAASQYQEDLSLLVSRYGDLGYSESGIEGGLRRHALEMETLLNKGKNSQLIADLLSMRGREKDFILRSHDRDAEGFRAAEAVFRTDLEASGLAPVLKSGLKKMVSDYSAEFERYVRITEEIRQIKTRYLKSVQTIEPVLEKLYLESLSRGETARQKLRALKDKVQPVKITVGLLTLALMLGIAHVVSRLISEAVIKSKSFAERIAAGNFEERLDIEGKSEFSVLAGSLNRMAESLHNAGIEQRKLEEQLRHSQKMEAIGTLTGGISHEFNNILHAILGYGELLSDGLEKSSPLRNYLNVIMSSARKASKLTKGLLAYSRKQILHRKLVPVNDILKNAGSVLSGTIGENIELQMDLTGDDVLVNVDSNQIEQTVINLASNAKDSMPEGGILKICAGVAEMDEEFIRANGYGEPGLYALLRVADTGTGMDDATMDKIFEPFFTTKDVGKGTGLGLSVVYGIVKAHNSYIDVKSVPGKGSTFYIYIPAIMAAAEKELPETGPQAPGGTETVLVAEDDNEVRGLITTLLRKYGYTVIEAADGEEAIKMARLNSDRINLLLCDVIMPKKNGKEVFNEVRKLNPQIRTLFLSGYTDEIIHGKGVLEEGVSFLSKPVSPSDLLNNIRFVLDA